MFSAKLKELIKKLDITQFSTKVNAKLIKSAMYHCDNVKNIYERTTRSARNITKTARMSLSLVVFSMHGPSDAMKFDHFLLICFIDIYIREKLF